MPLIGFALAASLGATAAWAIAVGPARNEPILDSRLIDYALHHPPPSGHIAAYAGVGSYMLWRSPRARVELDGWLEHFSPRSCALPMPFSTDALPNPAPIVRRLRIGAVIVDRHRAISMLRAHGFGLVFRTSAGSYLIKEERGPGPAGVSRRLLRKHRSRAGGTASTKVAGYKEGDQGRGDHGDRVSA